MKLTKRSLCQQFSEKNPQTTKFSGWKEQRGFETYGSLKEAYNELDKLSADKQKRLESEARQKAIRDKNILLITGENRGLEKGIQATIKTCQNCHISKESLIKNLMENFSLSNSEAVTYIEKYWK